MGSLRSLVMVDVHDFMAPDSGDMVFSSRAEGPRAPRDRKSYQTALSRGSQTGAAERQLKRSQGVVERVVGLGNCGIPAGGERK